MNLFKQLGLFPKRLLKDAYNPKALEAAFARASNQVHAKYRDPDGSLRVADRFGLGGYSVPLPFMGQLKSSLIYGERWNANALQAGETRAATTTERDDAQAMQQSELAGIITAREESEVVLPN